MASSRKSGGDDGKRAGGTSAGAIGYKQPPANKQFTKGQSGNPHGRYKGTRNVATLTKEALNQQVRVRSGDETHEMLAVEAICRVLANKAAQGNMRAAALVDKLRNMAGTDSGFTEEERQKRGLRLPRPYQWDEFDLIRAPARE